MARTTSSEFAEWCAFMDQEDAESFRRQDYYLAQIAAEVRRSYVKRPETVKIEDLLLKFTEEERPKRSPEEELAHQKACFYRALGLGG